MVVANKLRAPLGFDLVPLQLAIPSWECGLLLDACSAAERGDPVPAINRARHPLVGK